MRLFRPPLMPRYRLNRRNQRNRLNPWRYLLLGWLALTIVIALPWLPSAGFSAAASAGVTASASSPAAAGLDQGRSLYAAGRYHQAATVWQQAASEFEAQNDWANQALSLSYLSLAQQKLNQWQAAETAIQQSLALLQASDRADEAVLLAQALNTQASLLLQQGQTQKALSVWQQAETAYQQAGDLLGRMGSQINQVQALQILGFYRRSRDLLQQMSQQLETLPASTLKVSGLRTLGLALRTVGDLAASRDRLQASLTLAEQLQVPAEYSACWLALGKTAADQGDLEMAMTYFQQAERQSLEAADQLQARLSQLHLYTEARQALAKQQWYPVDALAVEIYQQLSDLPPSRTAIYGTVNLVAQLLQLEDAQPIPELQLAQLLAQAVQSAQALQDPLAEAHALAQWGKLYASTHQWSEASRLIQQALTLARQMQADDVAAGAAWQLGKILRQQGNRTEAIAAYNEAVNALQALRRDLVAVNTDVQFSFRKSVEPVYRELVSLLLDHQPDQTALVRARELIEALQQAELDNFFREACLDGSPQQIDQLDQRAAVIYPIILPDRLATVLSLPGQPLRYYATEIPQAQVERQLRQLLAAFHPVMARQTQIQLSQQLYDWLIRPAEAQQWLSQVDTLVFVPDGLLRSIPMAALHDGQQFLIEKYAVSLSPGLRLMTTQAQQERLKAVVGGISAARNGFAPLPAVATEIESISQLIPATALLNQDFTATALAQKLRSSSANIVHLATHGQFSSKLENTFLLTWEGRIDVNELADLLQQRTADPTQALDLLVLSACDTAAGDDRAVLGLAGMAVRSGAHATLATLWPVKDQAASLLMTAFYQALQQPGTTKAAALRQAQRSLIEQTDYTDPFFWAAFVLVGDWL
jgi:CHAT domain-containing protein